MKTWAFALLFTALAIAPVEAGKRIDVKLVNFSIEVPTGWQLPESDPDYMRNMLAELAGKGGTIADMMEEKGPRLRILNTRLTKRERDPRNPLIAVEAHAYEKAEQGDAVSVAENFAALKPEGEDADLNYEVAEETEIGGSPASITRFSGSVIAPKSKESVDVTGAFYTIVFPTHFIIIFTARQLDESEVVINDMNAAIASIKIN